MYMSNIRALTKYTLSVQELWHRFSRGITFSSQVSASGERKSFHHITTCTTHTVTSHTQHITTCTSTHTVIHAQCTCTSLKHTTLRAHLTWCTCITNTHVTHLHIYTPNTSVHALTHKTPAQLHNSPPLHLKPGTVEP